MSGRLLALQNEQGEPELPAIPDGGSLFIGLVQNPYGTPGEGSPAAPEEPGPSQEALQALALEALMELLFSAPLPDAGGDGGLPGGERASRAQRADDPGGDLPGAGDAALT